MSRSNGPATRGGGQAPQWRQAPEPGLPRPSAQHPSAQQHATHQQQWDNQLPDHSHQGYYDPAAGGHQANTAGHHPGYHYPEDGGQHAQAPYTPVHQPQAGPYTNPQPHPFDHYMNDQGHAAGYGAADHGHAADPAQANRHASRYDQWQGQRGYDLGSYMPAPSHQGYAPAHQPDPRWGDPGAADPHEYDPHGGHAGYYGDPGGALPVAHQPNDHDDGEYDFEEPAPRRRGLLIAVSLVGAIAVGGGLAYAYKTILGPSGKGATPVIRADSRPAKIQPTDPGGKQFAHSDMKLMGRLEPESGASSSNGSVDPDNGVRRVSTVTIARDGTITAPPPEPRQPAPSSFPGFTVVDTGSRGLPLPPRPADASSRGVPVAPVGASGLTGVQPVTIRPPAPAQQAEPEAAPAPRQRQAALPPAAPAEPPQAKAVPKRAAAPAEAPAAKSPSANGSGGSAGYVAVLSSSKSRMDALKAFADLQQRYAGVLQNKIPDVQEADLSARGLGTMYRAVVGPPGSREAANDICGQLKSAGYTGCWVTPY